MDNVSFFDGSNRFVIDKPIRLIELFAGIGAQAKALENLGVDFEHYRICEFDKYAVASYNAVHGTNFATSDMTKITADDLGIMDTDKYCYIMTYSFPCQDLSLAGKQRGMEKGAGTRSGLLWEVERLLDECKELPQVLVMENVPQVIGTKNIEHFAKWQEKLESLGYKNKWQVLNAKDFGIPQNRERCFMVSILGDYYYEFPKTMKLEKRLKDLLESEVDEKYYLSERMVDYFEKHGKECEDKGSGFRFSPVENTEVVAKAVTTRTGYRMDDNFIKLTELTSGQSQGNRVYDPNGLSVTLSANGGGLGAKTGLYLVDNEPVALDEQNNYIRKDGCVGTLTTDGSSPKHNNRVIEIQKVEIQQKVKVRKHIVNVEKLKEILRKHKKLSNKEMAHLLNKPVTLVEHWFRTDDNFSIPPKDVWFKLKEILEIETNEFDDSITEFIERDNVFEKSNRCYLDCGIAPTLTSTSADEKVLNNYRIRKLTPKECWRLMGFDDTDIDRAKATGMSDAQLYKQAGNSIVVNVLEAIIKNLLKNA